MKLSPGTDYTVTPTDLINRLLEYFDQRSDASNEGDGWKGNEASHFASDLREVLGEQR